MAEEEGVVLNIDSCISETLHTLSTDTVSKMEYSFLECQITDRNPFPYQLGQYSESSTALYKLKQKQTHVSMFDTRKSLLISSVQGDAHSDILKIK